ncbi:nucleotidyl transferase AbiEii/AbiGii toxin family protein [Kitasatospora sp. NPDC094015]|uniref:nucleotidyl transferase AbiEii/AbiGii toxin family protein n=1 Tax=Kitasatospora sp. NPDC094015 TaxID=3155205 RepID=UPI003323C511
MTTDTPDHTADPAADWDGFDYGPWEQVVLPRRAPGEEVREELDLPRSLAPIDDAGVTQQPVFDPALASYARALRPSEPAFADPELAPRWLAARREALATVLSAVAGSGWADHLVLRGSVLLRAWYGEAAREPGDLDFVVRPEDWQLEDERTGRMLDEIAAAAERLSGPVRLHADQALSDEIWTYSRVPGRRLVLPWSAPGLPGGTVQLDFVFTEHLPAEPRPAELPGVTGTLLAATPELSLAWKLLWLVTDNHPQGKDLYDAVLLASSAELSYELLRAAFCSSAEIWAAWPLLPAGLAELEVDWDEFRKDYPDLAEAGEELPARLAVALAPTFGGRTDHELRLHWLAPLIEECRQVLAGAGMAAVQEHLHRADVRELIRLVITDELLGGDLERAHDAVAAGLADSSYRLARLRRSADELAAERAGSQ